MDIDFSFIKKYKRYRIEGVVRRQLLYLLGLSLLPVLILLFASSIVLILLSIANLILYLILLVRYYNGLTFKIVNSQPNTASVTVRKFKHHFDRTGILFHEAAKYVYVVESVPLDGTNRKEIILFVFTEEGVLMNRALTNSLFFNIRLLTNTREFKKLLRSCQHIIAA